MKFNCETLATPKKGPVLLRHRRKKFILSRKRVVMPTFSRFFARRYGGGPSSTMHICFMKVRLSIAELRKPWRQMKRRKQNISARTSCSSAQTPSSAPKQVALSVSIPRRRPTLSVGSDEVGTRSDGTKPNLSLPPLSVVISI